MLQSVKFAPLSVPLERRLQTTAVFLSTGIMTFMPIICSVVFIMALFSRFALLALGYLAWIIYDVQITRTSSRGGRRIEALRCSRFWHYLRDFFPASLVKTGELDPKGNYLLGYHPHGIMGCGAWTNFASEATGFSDKYPGVRPHLMTLTANFRWPLLRGFLLWMGVCDVSKESIDWVLTKQGSGNAAVIVVGGAEEALQARPGNYDITLQRRKGFIKMAIRTGASLVPVFSFGENDLFVQADNPKGSYVRAFQDGFKKVFGFSPVLFYGRGIFNYTFGFVPYRKPIHTVVGSPIPVTQEDVPSPESVDKLHVRYMDELSQLFEGHKVEYGVDKDVHLNFI